MTVSWDLWSDDEVFNRDNALTISDTFSQNTRIALHVGDACQFLRTLPDGFAQLVVTSPPYNTGKEYEKKLYIQDYL